MDCEEITRYLEERRNKRFFIKRGEILSWEHICYFKNLVDSKTFKISEITEVIETGGDLSVYFIAVVPCFECKTFYVDCTLNKVNLIKLIKGELDTICDKCKKKLKKLKKEEAAKQRVQKKQKEELALDGNTVDYITTYLDPDSCWDKGLYIWDKIILIRADRVQVDWDYISGYIKEMPYQDFLKTPYWKAITHKKMKEAGFKCQICNGEGVLATHHRTYEIHGMEIFHLKELIVLCSNCHKKFHADTKRKEGRPSSET